MTSNVRRLSISVLASVFVVSSLLPASAGYVVKKGDTLWNIAREYHTTPEKIAAINNLGVNGRLKINACLSIPGEQSQPNITSNSSGSKVMHTNADNVCLRSGPGTGYERIAVLQEGTSVSVILNTGTWSKVSANGKSGYICNSLLDNGARSTKSGKYSREDPQNNVDRSGIIESALACQGLEYRRGGTSRGGFDCSGFTRYIYAMQGINLPHSSAAQANMGHSVDKSNLKPGDLVFFQTYSRGISHVGIYIGGNRFVHAATYRRGVRVDSLNSSYYRSRYRCARRIK